MSRRLGSALRTLVASEMMKLACSSVRRPSLNQKASQPLQSQTVLCCV